VRFGRKSRPAPEPEANETEEVAPPQGRGPHDAADVDVERDGVQRVDLGGLLIAPQPGTELRLQVDEDTQAVQSVLLAGPDGGMELRAFARSRGEEMWPGVKRALASDFSRRGGVSDEREGPWGSELHGQLQVQMEDGRMGTQASRVIGVDGPRWFVRATFLGRPAVDASAAGAFETMLSDLVVRRGTDAMAPGDPLPLRLPPSARRVDA